MQTSSAPVSSFLLLNTQNCLKWHFRCKLNMYCFHYQERCVFLDHIFCSSYNLFPEGRIHFFVLHHIKSCIDFRQVVWQQQDKNISKTCWVPNFVVYFLCLKLGPGHMNVKSVQIDTFLVKCTRLMILYSNKNLCFQVRQPLVIERKTHTSSSSSDS